MKKAKNFRLIVCRFVFFIFYLIFSFQTYATDYMRMAEEIARDSLKQRKGAREEALSFLESLQKDSFENPTHFNDFEEEPSEEEYEEANESFPLEEGERTKTNESSDLSYEPSVFGKKCAKGKGCQKEGFKTLKASPPNKSGKLFVFVSFSMKDVALKALYQRITPFGGRLLVRGLIENSFQKTRKKLMSLGIEMDIDPPLFKEYQIQKVPTYILVNSDGKGFDQVAGNISPKAALEIFKERGETRESAAFLLEKAKGELQ